MQSLEMLSVSAVAHFFVFVVLALLFVLDSLYKGMEGEEA
jgi:hypothetical protein